MPDADWADVLNVYLICPYYNREKPARIKCYKANKQYEFIDFENRDKKLEWEKMYCTRVCPADCPFYQQHVELIMQGLEEPEQPKAHKNPARKLQRKRYIEKKRQAL